MWIVKSLDLQDLMPCPSTAGGYGETRQLDSSLKACPDQSQKWQMATLALQVLVDDPADREMSSLHHGVMQMTDAAIISHPVIISYGFCKGGKRFV